MGAPTFGDRRQPVRVGDTRRQRLVRAVDAAATRFDTVDRLADSFPILPGESEWLMALLADDLARILGDD